MRILSAGSRSQIGYVRISTRDQNPRLQIDALEKEGCEKIFVEQASGSRADRPKLGEMMRYVRSGEMVVVWKLDRLGRNIKHLLEMIDEFERRDIAFKSLTEQMDTSSPNGKLIFTVFGAMAEFERAVNRGRTMAGLQVAREKGRFGGRRSALPAERLAEAEQFVAAGGTPASFCATFGLKQSTGYRLFKKISDAQDARNDDTGAGALPLQPQDR